MRIAEAALIALLAAGARAEEAAPPSDEPRGEVLSLDAAVARALDRHPQARTAREEVTRAWAVVEEVRAASLPTLYGAASYLRLDGDRTLNGSVIAPANQEAASLTVALPLVAARPWVQWSHARRDAEVARLSVDEVRRQLALATARTYLEVLAQKRVVEVSRRAVANDEAHYAYAHARFQGGYGNRVDEVRAAQELASDRAQVESARVSLERLRESLSVLVASDGPVDAEEQVALPPLQPLDEALRAARERSDVLLARGRLDSARRVARDDWADYLPTLTGTFTPFYQHPPLLTTPELGWQAQLALSLPLYDGGQRYGLAHERAALVREAEQALDGTLRQAGSDVRAAWQALQRGQAALVAAREAARLGAEGLQLTTLAYRAGATTNIEVIDAERRARDADTQMALAEDTFRQAQLDFLVATGRFPKP